MTINKQSASYKIAHTMYLSLGGDPEKEFTSVEEIYQGVDQIYGESGGRVTVEPLKVELTTNGTTVFDDTNITGYKPVEVSVNVDVGTAYDDGYNTGVADQKGKLESISITENGTYSREDGYNQVKVNVQGKLEVPFEEIGYMSELKNELNNYLNSKPLSDLEYSKSLYDAWDPSKTIASRLYINDTNLVYAPLIDTSKVTNMSNMFDGCSQLSTVPLFDTSNVTSMSYMFYNCSQLTAVPLFDTSNVINIDSMFRGCSQLTAIPLFDTSKVTSMFNMFYNCSQLTAIPLFDTSKVTNMNSMFYNCSQLTAIPLFDTSKVTNMSSTFESCTSLTVIPLLDCGNVNNVGYMFGFSNLTNLTEMGGLKDLGKQSNLSIVSSYFINKCTSLTYESAMNIINNLYDRKSAGYSVLTIKLDSKVLALLSDDDIAIATNKGWIIS